VLSDKWGWVASPEDTCYSWLGILASEEKYIKITNLFKKNKKNKKILITKLKKNK